jgi:hypothetical protein
MSAGFAHGAEIGHRLEGAVLPQIQLAAGEAQLVALPGVGALLGLEQERGRLIRIAEGDRGARHHIAGMRVAAVAFEHGAHRGDRVGNTTELDEALCLGGRRWRSGGGPGARGSAHQALTG